MGDDAIAVLPLIGLGALGLYGLIGGIGVVYEILRDYVNGRREEKRRLMRRAQALEERRASD